MISPGWVMFAFVLYLATLFVVAVWVEGRKKRRSGFLRNPIVYTLSLAVYFTAWTFYGSVGTAARDGYYFLAVYIGPVIAATLWWAVLRRMVRVKNRERVTSIADYISLRYGKSQAVATLVTLIALIGITPYIALQLKSIFTTFAVLTGDAYYDPRALLVSLLILFTIILGARRLDPSERHEGIVAVVAIESVVKLVVFLIVGLFVVYGLFDGFSDLFAQLDASPHREALMGHRASVHSDQLWFTAIVLSIFAILLLPRQFHVGVVENHQERHIRTAMWLFPAYMGLLVLFIIPIAYGGLLLGFPVEKADTFVLRLPMESGNSWLALLVFLGGFSASTGMVMVSSMALSTMLTNHLLVPMLTAVPRLDGLKRHLLRFRWAAIALVVLMGFWFDRQVSSTYNLVNIGLFSFAAIAQFAPAGLLGQFWRGGTRSGALWGLGSGFVLWVYTLMLPVFIRAGFLPELQGILESGPFGLGWLHPERLFGLEGLNPITHSTFWSLGINTLLYVVVSRMSSPGSDEEETARRVVDVLSQEVALADLESSEIVSLAAKRPIIDALINGHFSSLQARTILDDLETRFGLDREGPISVLELAELAREIERILAGAFGSATAFRAMIQANLLSARERRALSAAYGGILAHLQVSPEELRARIDYYREREDLLRVHARQLEQTIATREREIAERQRVELALRESEERYRLLVEASPTGIFIHAEGRLVYANTVGARMLGAEDPHELIGERIARFLPPTLHLQLPEKGRHLTETQGELPLMESELTRLDGSPVPVDVTAIPFMFRDLPAFQVVAIDTTARREAERREQALEAQVRQQQKMEAIGTLASGVAHEINNPINAILNYGQLIHDRLPGTNDLRTFADEIIKESNRVSRIVYNLLTYSRQEREHYAPVDVREIVESAMMLIRTVIRKDRIELHTEIPDSLPGVKGHGQQIQQVLLNLITNGRDAINERRAREQMQEEGTIHLSACRVSDGEGEWLRLTVRDNGCGLTQETQTRMFDPFFTTKPRGVGTGLGLSVSQGIVLEHKGRLSAEAVPGGGTAFHLDLPL